MRRTRILRTLRGSCTVISITWSYIPAFKLRSAWTLVQEVVFAAGKLRRHFLFTSTLILYSYTMTRAILADAITLVRGDRYYTHDFTPANLTCWGFQDCVRDPNNGAFGAALPKLLMRHLPRHYPSVSDPVLFLAPSHWMSFCRKASTRYSHSLRPM